MAVLLDASTPAKATGTATTVTTLSFTPPSGSLITLCYMANDGTGTTDVKASAMANTGTAITWARTVSKGLWTGSLGGAGQPGVSEIWTGVGTGGAITCTATGVGTGTGSEKMLKALVWTGADTTTFNVAAAASPSTAGVFPSATLASALAGSFGLAASSDWAQKGLGTAGTGQTMVDENNVSGQITEHVWRTTSALGSSGNQTMNQTAPTLQQFNIVALEIRAASGTATAPRIQRMPTRVPILRASTF